MSDTDEVDFGDNVDRATFDQILEMDDEDDGHEFSSSIVFDFLKQAESTFVRMDRLIEDEDLDALSAQGHFLKGSSATLGFVYIRDACEKIQHYGHKEHEDGTKGLDEETALKLIKESIADAKDAYRRVERLMYRYFGPPKD